MSRYFNQEDLVLPNLQKIAYINATEHVQGYVAQRARGVILHDLSLESFSMYQKLEELQTKKIWIDIANIYDASVRPALRWYLDSRYSLELEDFLRKVKTDIFWNIEIILRTRPSTLGQCCETEPILTWNRVASCGYSEGGDWNSRVIYVYFEELMESEAFREISSETFEDVVLQVVLHEYLHAVSAKRHMTIDEVQATQRVVAVREAIDNDTVPYWEDIATSFGYACNFVDTEGYRLISGLESINEAITETLAAKIYSEYTRNKYWKSKKYSVSYMRECHAYSKTLKKFSKQWNMPLPKLVKEIELGYFFSDERREITMNDRILPMLEYYLAITKAQSEE